jgi:fatty-acyl-CoA synthase
MFVNDFPINISGKIQKYKMREESIKVLGLHEADKIETA